MKKIFGIGSLVLVLALAAGASGLAFAQTQPPEAAPEAVPQDYPMGARMRSAPGGMAQMMGRMMSQQGMGVSGMGDCLLGEPGLMHEYMVSAWAEGLGLDAADLQSRLDDGERMVDIAASLGFSFEQIKELMLEVKTAAFEQAVEDGIIAPEQAELMQQRMERSSERGNGMGHGGMGRSGGMRGQGMRGGQPQQ